MYKRGYNGTSMRDIAAAVEIEAASLYNHIGQKDDILKITCFELAEKFLAGIGDIASRDLNPMEKFRAAVHMHVEILCADVHASYVFLYEWKHINEQFLARFVSMRDQYEHAFKEILGAGEKQGYFQNAGNKFAVLTVLSSMNWIVQWYKPDGYMHPAEIANQLTDFILSGLLKEK